MDKLDLEIHYAGDWAALYVNGKLTEVGDEYIAVDRALSLLGVKQVYDEAFMRGQRQRVGVAQTLTEVEEYRTARDERSKRAMELHEEAARLTAEAKALEALNG